jgi:DNA-binding response OmpR family regulator
MKKEMSDLIILDIMIPDMSRWKVYDIIRDNPSWRDIPIVFLTARKDKVAENAGQFLGGDFIEKPIEINELKRRINKVLGKNGISSFEYPSTYPPAKKLFKLIICLINAKKELDAQWNYLNPLRKN